MVQFQITLVIWDQKVLVLHMIDGLVTAIQSMRMILCNFELLHFLAMLRIFVIMVIIMILVIMVMLRVLVIKVMLRVWVMMVMLRVLLVIMVMPRVWVIMEIIMVMYMVIGNVGNFVRCFPVLGIFQGFTLTATG